MKIERFKYHEKFCVKSTFLDTSIDVEGTLDEGETLKDAVIKARAEIMTCLPAQELQTSWKDEIEIPRGRSYPLSPEECTPLRIISKDHEKMEIEIDNCATADDLKQWKSNNPVVPHPILQHYNERLKQLSI